METDSGRPPEPTGLDGGVQTNREGGKTRRASLPVDLHLHWHILLVVATLASISAVALLVFRSHLMAAWDLMRLMAITRSFGDFSLPLMGGSHLLPSSDLHFGPYLALVAMVWRMLGGTPQALERAFAIFGVLGTVVLSLSLYRLCLLLVGKPAKAALCVASTFFLWGPVHTFWAGDYSVIGTMYASMYPQAIAYALGFACISFCIRYVALGRRRDLALLGIFFFLVSLTHLFTSLFVILGIVSLASARPGLRESIKVLAVIAVAGGLVLLWPFFDLPAALGKMFGGSSKLSAGIIIGAAYLLAALYVVRIGWAHRGFLSMIIIKYRLWLLGAIVYMGWMIRVAATKGLLFFTSPMDKRLLGGTGLAGFLGIREIKPANYYLLTWSACSLVIYWGGKGAGKLGSSFPLWHRFIFFGMLPLHILLGIVVFDGLRTLATRRARVAAAAMLIVTAAVFGVSGTMVLADRETFISIEVEEAYTMIPDGSVVVADDITSEILAGYFGITTLWPILTEEEDAKRSAYIEDFYQPETDTARLLQMASEYGADCLVLRLPRAEEGNTSLVLREKFGRSFERIGGNQRYIVYDIPITDGEGI